MNKPPPHKQGIRPENQFCCVVCDFYFSTFKSLNQHQIKKHGPEFARMQKQILLAGGNLGNVSKGPDVDLQTKRRAQVKSKPSDPKHTQKTENCDKSQNDENNKESVSEAFRRSKTSEEQDVTGSCQATAGDPNSKESHCHSSDSDTEVKEERTQPSDSNEQFSYTPRLLLQKFRCKFCPAEFRYHCDLKLHTLKHTGAKPHRCDICSKAFRLASVLNRHKREHTGEMPYACGKCSQKFQDSSLLNRHIKTQHKEEGKHRTAVKGRRRVKHRDSTASEDDQEDTGDEETTKLKEEAEEGLTSQDDVSPAADSAADAKPTGQGEDGKQTYQCRVCSALFPSTRSFAQHMKRHPEVLEIHHCPQCDCGFRYIKDYYAHIRSIHNMRLFSCPDCGKTYKQAIALSEHRLKHSGQRPFMCESCGRTYIRATDLRRHERLHTNDRAFRCRVCGNTYLQLTHLINHRRSHSGEQI